MLWKDLKYWDTGEWQVVDERLKELTRRRINWTPGRKNLFKALDATPFDLVKCVIVGQDPYPNPLYATGLAFSIPPESKQIPATLANIIRELNDDVRVYPENGDLSEWTQEGVLLWNVLLSCCGKPMSHNWEEYYPLTQEIFSELSKKGIVFVLMGKWAEGFRKFIDEDNSEVIVTSHPSPRGNMPLGSKHRSAQAFLGSKLFSTINIKLVELGHEPIDWRTHLPSVVD